jgi:hypothetical protein
MKQYGRDPTGKTMKVVETDTKDSYTDGFEGYGWASEHMLVVKHDAFNPFNKKGPKIVADIIAGNKGIKQHKDHPGDPEWLMYFVSQKEEKITGDREGHKQSTEVTGDVDDPETARKMLEQMRASSSTSAAPDVVLTLKQKQAARAVAKAEAKEKREAKAAEAKEKKEAKEAEAKEKKEAEAAANGGRIPAKKRKSIAKENIIFIEKLQKIKKTNTSVRLLENLTRHDMLSVKSMDEFIAKLEVLKVKFNDLAEAPISPTDDVIDLLLKEKALLLGEVADEETYQIDRLKRVLAAKVAVQPSSLSSASEPARP